jgi:hypothetical protein
MSNVTLLIFFSCYVLGYKYSTIRSQISSKSGVTGQHAPMIMILAPKIIGKIQAVFQALVLISYEKLESNNHT